MCCTIDPSQEIKNNVIQDPRILFKLYITQQKRGYLIESYSVSIVRPEVDLLFFYTDVKNVIVRLALAGVATQITIPWLACLLAII